MKMSTTGRQWSSGEIQIITTSSKKITTGRSSNQVMLWKQRELPVGKIWLPVDDAENKTFPNLRTFDFLF